MRVRVRVRIRARVRVRVGPLVCLVALFERASSMFFLHVTQPSLLSDKPCGVRIELGVHPKVASSN